MFISNTATQVKNWWISPAPVQAPEPALPTTISKPQVVVVDPCTCSVATRVILAVSRAFYALIDAMQRIASITDGVDKSLKFIGGLSIWMMAGGFSALFWQELADKTNFVDRIFTAVALFGRVNEFTGVDSEGNPTACKRIQQDPLKMANTFFLVLNKTCEMGRLLQNVGIWTTQGAVALDAAYLGGFVARIGGASIIGRVAFNAGLGSCKNAFLVTACVFSITNNTISIARQEFLKNKENARFDLARLALSIGADTGKILLVAMTFAVSFSFAAVAISTAVLSLVKIVMDSYKSDWDRMKKEKNPDIIWGPNYPQWMRV